ncbi:MAG: PIN domain-containing protein [Chloroflexales bacterium]
MKILVDTNVVLDVLLDRAPWADDASQIWRACETGRLHGCVPGSALTTIFYVARRMTTLRTAQVAVGLCLATFDVLPVDRAALEHATMLAGSDFEDNVQLACALAAGMDAIVTRNGSDFRDSPVLLLTPAELVAQL